MYCGISSVRQQSRFGKFVGPLWHQVPEDSLRIGLHSWVKIQKNYFLRPLKYITWDKTLAGLAKMTTRRVIVASICPL